MLSTWLTTTLSLDIPIIGAPMAGRAGGRLARAVTSAGGLGMIGAGSNATPEWLRENVAAATTPDSHAPDGARFGVGLMVWSIDRDRALFDAVLAERPAVVSLSFGDPAPYVQEVRDAGALIMTQVNTLADLRRAEDAGVDFVVAQGTDAGGHTGHIGTLPLLQQILDATSLPVLAAGGIATGRGLAAVLAAGAEGAVVGTALLGSPEAEIPEALRERLFTADGDETVYTRAFDTALGTPWPERWGGRAIHNRFTDQWDGKLGELSADGQPGDLVRAANKSGNPDAAGLYAGQGVGMLTHSAPAADVVSTIAAGAEELLGRF